MNRAPKRREPHRNDREDADIVPLSEDALGRVQGGSGDYPAVEYDFTPNQLSGKTRR